MRQFFSWRFWAAVGAVLLLAVGWKWLAPDSGVAGVGPAGPEPRIVQFVSLVYSVDRTASFEMEKGVVQGSADFVLDGQRTMHVVAGTPGEMDCPEVSEIGRCVVLADLLGDAVVWFALVPVETGLKVQAPPIVELLDDGIARLRNGWLVPYASTVDRRCDQETDSLSDFIDDQGPGSTTIIDVARQRITQVVCATADAESSTTTTAPPVPTFIPEDPNAPLGTGEGEPAFEDEPTTTLPAGPP